MIWVILSTLIAFIIAFSMIFIRLKSAKKPVSVKKIILPPLFMSTGTVMFLIPALQITWSQVFEAFIVGVIFSVFLIKTSRFETKDKDIYLIPSKAFAFILFGLLILRIFLKLIISTQISLAETSGMFFILAFGMILSWRVSMLIKFKELKNKINHQIKSDYQSR